MATIKARIEAMEKRRPPDCGLIKRYGMGSMYGDDADFTIVTQREFKRLAGCGLAGFYEDFENQGDVNAKTN